MVAESGIERRVHARAASSLAAKVLFEDGELSVTILNLSMGGAKIRYDPAFSNLPAQFILRCPAFGSIQVESRWRRQGQMGLMFLNPGLQKARLAMVVEELQTAQTTD